MKCCDSEYYLLIDTSSFLPQVRSLFVEVFECSKDDPLYPPPSTLGSFFHVANELVQVSISIDNGVKERDGK